MLTAAAKQLTDLKTKQKQEKKSAIPNENHYSRLEV